MQECSIKPLQNIEYIYSNNTKLAYAILNNQIPIDGKYHGLNVLEDAEIKIAIRYPKRKDFQFLPIDALILDAIGSLHDNGLYHFTTDMIAKIIYQDIHHRATAKTLKTIRDRLTEMMALKIRINIDEESWVRKKAFQDERLEGKHYHPFLPIEEIEVVFSANSKKGEGYRLCWTPPLWSYAKYTKQVIACNFDVFSSLKVNKTLETLLILKYVHHRVEMMKNPKNKMRNPKIGLYRLENHVPKGLLPACGIDPSKFKNWNDKHKKICDLIDAFLTVLKQEKEPKLRIKDYRYYNNASGEGFRIDLYSRRSNKHYHKK